jgi:hypothetical protein
MRTITTVLMSSMPAILNEEDTARNRRQQLSLRHGEQATEAQLGREAPSPARKSLGPVSSVY